MTENDKRLRREAKAFASMRKAKRGRVSIDRTPLRILTGEGGVKKRVHGAGIVVTPQLHNRDRRKAFARLCEVNRVMLIPVAWTDHAPPGIDPAAVRPEGRVLSYLALGPPAALKAVVEHAYVGPTNWIYATTFRGGGSAPKMAPKPRAAGKNDEPPADGSGWGALQTDRQERAAAVADAYRRADEWTAAVVESATAEQSHYLREVLCCWFVESDAPPADLEAVAEYAATVEFE